MHVAPSVKPTCFSSHLWLCRNHRQIVGMGLSIIFLLFCFFYALRFMSPEAIIFYVPLLIVIDVFGFTFLFYQHYEILILQYHIADIWLSYFDLKGIFNDRFLATFLWFEVFFFSHLGLIVVSNFSKITKKVNTWLDFEWFCHFRPAQHPSN